MSGKTTYLLDLSDNMVSNGLKVCFIGGSSELEESFNLRKMVTIARFIKKFRTNSDLYNLKVLESLKEITHREKYDFIMIDDLDQISKKCIEFLKTINIKKIATCSENNIPILNESISKHRILNHMIDGYDSKNLSKLILRDKKIKHILND